MPRMKHPQHGWHNAAPHEVSDMEARGWRVEDAAPAPSAAAAQETAAAASAASTGGDGSPPAPAPAAAAAPSEGKRGPGRPPKPRG